MDVGFLQFPSRVWGKLSGRLFDERRNLRGEPSVEACSFYADKKIVLGRRCCPALFFRAFENVLLTFCPWLESNLGSESTSTPQRGVKC